jgi:putative nucleotidyltransferase with HDIG domain
MDNIKEVFKQINTNLIEIEKPSVFLEELYNQNTLNVLPFVMLTNLKNTEQSPKHHPEGNVWNHTMLVVDECAKVKNNSSDKRVFMWSALLHDIGKYSATRKQKGKITAYNHDKIGAKMVEEFFSYFDEENDFIDKVLSLVRWHMQILFVVNNLVFADIKNMKQQVNIDDIALLGLCDRLGRVGADRKKEEENIKVFLKKCKN